jgi:response regulator RpfG family c-di-GMP phosphodiesterase
LSEVFANANILMVDDEEPNVRFVRRMLARDGITAFTSVTDSRDAVEEYRRLSPDLVLMDLHMPHKDGFTVMGELTPLIRDGDFVPILVMTADLSPEVRNQALRLGASDFLTKPFDVTEARLRVSNLLRTRSLHLALRSHNRLLEARVRARTHELEEAQLEILQRLASVSEFHDSGTGEHIQRVGRLAMLLACRLGLSEAEADLIGRAALLHDVGKIAIPGEIHTKRGPLSAEEFARMTEHTKIGGRLLAGSRFAVLRKAEEIALSHHERWDGSGYPNGLKEENIPLAGRIVAVADVFDALTHKRHYKNAWPLHVALAEIQDQSGRHFDPRIVEALLDLHHSGELVPAEPLVASG